jgi:hypothetical protein
MHHPKRHHLIAGLAVVLFSLAIAFTLNTNAASPPPPEDTDSLGGYRPVEDDTAPQVLPAGIPADWWAIVQEDIRQSEYHVSWQDLTYLSDVPAAYQAANRAHNLRTYFTPEGIRIIQRDTTSPEWELHLGLEDYAPADDLFSSANRIEYLREKSPQGVVCEQCRGSGSWLRDTSLRKPVRGFPWAQHHLHARPNPCR